LSTRKNVIYNFLLTGSGLLFPILTFPYLSRVIGADGLGTSNFIFSYCQNFIIIAALGLPMYSIREIARLGDDKPKRSKLFFELLSLHVIFTIFLMIVYFLSLSLNPDFKNFKQLTFFGGIFILLNSMTVEWLFSGVSDFKFIAIRSLIIRALSVLSIFIFVKQKEDFNIYFIILVITLLLTVIANINYARKYISLNVHFTLKDVFLHSKPVFLLGLYMVLNSVNGQIPPTLLGFLSTKEAVGYFFAAQKIILLTISIFGALTAVMIPKANLVIDKKESDEYYLLIHKLLNIAISFGIPITFLVYLLANPLVMLLGGEGFVNSIFCLQIMAPIILIVAFAQIFVLLILNVNRKDKEIVLITAIGMVIGLIINVVFIPRYAERSAAFAQLAVELLVTSAAFYLSKRVCNFRFPIKLFLFNLIFVIPFMAVTYLWIRITDNIILIILLSGISCGLYFLFYQLMLIKDKFILELFEPYLRLLKNPFYSGRGK